MFANLPEGFELRTTKYGDPDYVNAVLLKLHFQLSKQSARSVKNIKDFVKILMPVGTYYWVTINWNPNTYNLELIKTKIQDILTLPHINKYWYNYEQRGKIEGDFKGFHNHMLICNTSNKPPARSIIQRDIYRKIKNLVGNIKHVDVYKTPFASDKIYYLNGLKIHSEKECMILNDIKYRSRYNLNRLYYSDVINIPPQITKESVDDRIADLTDYINKVDKRTKERERLMQVNRFNPDSLWYQHYPLEFD